MKSSNISVITPRKRINVTLNRRSKNPNIIVRQKTEQFPTPVKEKQSSSITLEEYANSWLKRKKDMIELDTWEGYESIIRVHIIPYFNKNNTKICDITPEMIRTYYEYELREGRKDNKTGGVSCKSLKHYSSVLKQILKDALISELISYNPAALIPLPKKEHDSHVANFLEVNEAMEMLNALKEHELYPLIFITLYYGLRRSEVLGLRWDAINFEKDSLSIQHTVVKNATVEKKDKTKNDSSRRIYPLLPQVKEILLKVKAKQNRNRKLFGSDYKESDYVFTWADGSLLYPDGLTKGFKRALKKNNLRVIRFHDLRHSTASILYSLGWELKDIQIWLGHSNIETTGNIYTHIERSRKMKVGQNLDDIFLSTGKQNVST